MLFFVRFEVTQAANVSNAELIDTWKREAEAALGGLPIMREQGPSVKTTAVAIYDYKTFAEDLNAGAHG